ncbi:MAG: hypothetical protein JWR72_2949 [Flavisolibacter sp.]|nr:hypothetical protein [Flavisolibacter sp.]
MSSNKGILAGNFQLPNLIFCHRKIENRLILVSVKTEIEWTGDIAAVPIIGHGFAFLLIFIPAVLSSFLTQEIIPGISDETGFTKAMIILLPTWNLVMWFLKIKLFILFIPSWLLLGVISVIKIIQMF